MPDGLTGGPTSQEALAAELRRLLLAADRRPDGRGQRKRSALARSIGVSASSLYAYLDGTTLPPTEVLDRLLVALDVADAERGRLATARDAIEVGRRSRRTTVPRQLPAPPQVFTGRTRELSAVEQIHDASTVVITTIDGMAGVGKTALALHAAHRTADRYPDGQLFIDLHGFTPGTAPVEPAEALDRMLRALDIPGTQIPAGLDDRAALFRSRLADKRMLIFLDNAATEAQITPLLPGASGCLVLVTSRRRLAGLDQTRTLSLDTLPVPDAVTLFLETAGDDRLAGQEPALLTELVELCGRLPLAIRIAAARLRSHSSWRLSYLVDRLRDQRHRLAELEAGHRSVTAALDLSYHHLRPDQRRAYRLLGLHPGVDFDAYATAALLDSSLPEASRMLDRLLDAHLLLEPGSGRYQFHDLTRAHAAQIVIRDQDESTRDAAVDRLLDHYRHTASVAMDAAYPHDRAYRRQVPPAATPTPDLAGTGAVGWLETELPNLLAAAEYASDARPAHVAHLSSLLHRHLRTRGHYHNAETLHQRALDAARTISDQAGELDALTGLAYIHGLQGRHAQAIGHFGQALQIARDTGHRPSELDALTGLAYVHWLQGRYEPAIDHFELALQIARDTGHRPSELDALTGLAFVHWLQGRYEQATSHYEQALQIARTTGHRPSELIALTGLGHVHRMQGRYEQATSHYEQAVRVARATGHRPGELDALTGLGHVHRMQGRYEQAISHFGRALRTARAIGERPGELDALTGLGQVHRMQGRYEHAAGSFRELLRLAQEGGRGNFEFEAWQGLGRLQTAAGHPEAAITDHERALALATELGQPDDQARARDGLARAHHALNQREQARRHWQHALELLTSLGIDHTDDPETTPAAIRAHLGSRHGSPVPRGHVPATRTGSAGP